jgi:hypothetical protein
VPDANRVCSEKAVAPWVHDALIALGAALAQKKLDEGNDAEDTLAAVKRADQAAGAVDDMFDAADVLRDLRKRGRLRDLP